MKTQLSFIAITACALLVGCGGNSSSITVNEVSPATDDGTPKSRIQFQPGEGRLALPNDILFSGTIDGTLEPPAESAAKASGAAVDLGDPAAALGSVDGWSTSTPMLLSLDMAEGSTLDASSVDGSSVVFVETDCAPGLANCSSFSPLSYGVDYVAQVIAESNRLAIAPLRPLKSATTYLVGVTTGVRDSRNEAIAPSLFYEQVSRSDVDLSGSATLGALQAAINGYETLLATATGLSADDFAYSASWTTGSAGAGFTGVLAQLAQTSALAPATLSISDVAHGLDADAPVTVRAALVLQLTAQLVGQGLDAATANAQAEAAVPEAFNNSLLLQASVTLPYYSGTPEDGSDPLRNGWTAACDSGALLAAASADTLAAATPGANDDFCTAFGLRDLGLDSERYITRFNPIPQARAQAQLAVQITVPNPALLPPPWPVVVVQHGIGSRKEDTLAMSAAFSAAGLATFAIDHPLHGSRALASASAGAEVNASGNPTVYMNLAHLPTAKDNLNQSVADLLGLRAALNNGIAGIYSSDDFDLSTIGFMGMSLGAITGVNFLDLAQSSAALTAALQLPPLDLAFSQASLVSPGGGIAPLLIDSASFGATIKGSVLAGLAGPEGPAVANNFIAFIGGNTANCGAEDLGCHYDDYLPTLDAASLGVVGASVAQFAFAAQTIVNSADPLNYGARLGAGDVDLFAIEIVGDGEANLPDQVIPNQTSVAGYRFGGTEPLAAVMGLPGVGGNNAPLNEGIVRYTAGHHASLLRAAAQASAVATETENAVQAEMQRSVAAFLAGQGVTVTDDRFIADGPSP